MRVVIAEDFALLREGVARILTARGHQVVAAVGDAVALLDAVGEHRPDVCVVDVRMPPGNADDGLRAALLIRRRHPEIGVLVLSQYVEEQYASELLAESPARVGYLLKERVADGDEFVAALERVAAGGTALDPVAVSQLFARSRNHRQLESLTLREREVLAAMAEGLSNSAIAATLRVSAGAVEKHIGNVFAKLGLAPDEAGNRRVLAVLAYLNRGG